MDLPWGDERSEKFISNVGLITTEGPYGPNVMAAEWTYQVSYSPGLLAVIIGSEKATLENIRHSGEFGVSLASVDQTVIASVSGRYTAKEVDKIGLLKDLGLRFYKAKRINCPMVEAAAMNAECTLANELIVGSYNMFIGEVVEASASEEKPVAYHAGRYWSMDTSLEKPSQQERERIKILAEKHLVPQR